VPGNAVPELIDLAIVGGGAAGLATAIFAARSQRGRVIVILDGTKKLGAKILVAGGGRCNVTNGVVTAADFCGGNPRLIKRVLAAFPVERTVSFLREIGVELHEEENGKLYPNTNQARTVLEALLNETGRLGVHILTEHRVTAVEACDPGFRILTGEKTLRARRVVLATGGLSLPKTGSDGGGYGLAQGLGHTLVPTTPALVPLVLTGDFHAPLSGISQDVELTVRAGGAKAIRIRGALLWTHFGISGPAVLDASRHWHRARLAGGDVSVAANYLPGEDFAAAERRVLALASSQPKALLRNALSRLLPARVAAAVLRKLEIEEALPMVHLPRDLRRKLVHALLAWPLPVVGSRGYVQAEVTAGGVPLSEIDPGSMASRKCPGLYLVGEILDVDGRIGGFNFQWAWSSAWVAAAGCR
jgi:predicted Rossmann fold flavoprotein